MEVVKELRDCLHIIFTVQFWRMAVLWTLALVFSYLKLFSQTILLQKSKRYSRRSPKDCISASAPVTRPVCIITGATSGLGAAASYALSKEGFYVVLAGRSSELLSKVISDIKRRNNDACVKAFQVDITSFESILKFKSSLQQWLLDSNMHSSVQLLINNAGILATSRRLTSEGYDQMITSNYIGAFCLTEVLLPLLENSLVPSRVVNVTSFTHWSVRSMLVDRGTMKCFSKSKCYPFAHIYEYSKLCLLLFSYELHRQVGQMEKSHKLSVVAVDPGAVKTNIMREIPSGISQMSYIVLKILGLLQSPENAVCSILDAALAPPVSIAYPNNMLLICALSLIVVCVNNEADRISAYWNDMLGNIRSLLLWRKRNSTLLPKTLQLKRESVMCFVPTWSRGVKIGKWDCGRCRLILTKDICLHMKEFPERLYCKPKILAVAVCKRLSMHNACPPTCPFPKTFAMTKSRHCASNLQQFSLVESYICR
ncbi:Uncharacterized protein Fot_38343 [Forsythia ovata]|uniref:Uncharacterized protein n=1 Tax=Forsythia ovata TaxID=205694 RepID=A0ABD1S1I8_9LAMI